MVSDEETERTAVKTYVPRYQKEIWEEHAADLGMSQSEFVRSMVQAGRRGFGGEDPGSEGSNPGGDGLEDRVRDVLAEEGAADWAALRKRLAEEFEARLEETLADLQHRNEIAHSPRRGGYTLRGEQ